VSRVLVTGATGFIGRHALEPLVRAGHEVHAVSSQAVGSRDSGEVTWHRVDLLADPVAVVEAVRPQRLLHLAWYAEHGKFWTSIENLRWVEATQALTRAFAAAGGERAVCAGTCAEYDWTAGRAMLAEDAPRHPTTFYGVAKNATYEVLEAAGAELGIALAWGRVFFLYGPGEDERRLVASVASALARGERAETGDGSQRRDLMHVSDVGAAFAALVDSEVAGAVNVASGVPTTLRHAIETIGRAAGREDLLHIGALPPRLGDPDDLVADVTRLRDEVGFRSRVGLDAGLAETFEWWRERTER
jgi:nucleoside-diphosphate-sugar epimerase